ncbi:Cro/CI family transcriptional regulator [Kingella negevensis]|uniref:Cro/CI family transcriptional regulator n=1 Tax=Kingella negevensis TaxID=1522312 RepID=UPI000A9EF046|nr:Cro/CI family transcriptional regulator [Kingella negevensis]MDK4688521.1 Cro/CI family transcriptional regulator [Kingella negevensis]
MDNFNTRFINQLGGVKKVAEICGVTKGAVSQWKKNRIPLGHLNFLKTKFSKEYHQVKKCSDD